MGAPPPPLPVEDDPDTAGFWEAARRHELAVRACERCDAVIHAPTAFCAACGSWDTAWRVVAGTGTVYSWTVVEHPTHPAFEVPYTAVLVALDDVPARLIGHLPGRPDIRPGQAMRVRFEEREGGTVLPQWELLGP
jgi:uncharacterized OB-fold protein